MYRLEKEDELIGVHTMQTISKNEFSSERKRKWSMERQAKRRQREEMGDSPLLEEEQSDFMLSQTPIPFVLNPSLKRIFCFLDVVTVYSMCFSH